MPSLISPVLGVLIVALGLWGTFPDDLVASIDFGALGEDSRVTCNIAIDDLGPLGIGLALAGRGMAFGTLSREELALLRSTALPDAVERDGDGVELDGGVERLSMPLNWRNKDGLPFADADDEASLLGGAVADVAAGVFRGCSALTAVERADDPEGCSFATTSPGLKFLNSACFLELVSPGVVTAGLICPCLRNRALGFAPSVLSAGSSVPEVMLLDLRCVPPSLAPAEGASVEVALWDVSTFGELAITFDDVTPPEEAEVLACAECFRNLRSKTGFAITGEDVTDLDSKGVETGELDAADVTFSTELTDESRKSLGRFVAGVEESFVSAVRLRLVFSVGESTIGTVLTPEGVLFDPVRRDFCLLDPCEITGIGPEMISTSVDDAESISIGRAAEKPGDAVLEEDLDFSFSIFLGPVIFLNR